MVGTQNGAVTCSLKFHPFYWPTEARRGKFMSGINFNKPPTTIFSVETSCTMNFSFHLSSTLSTVMIRHARFPSLINHRGAPHPNHRYNFHWKISKSVAHKELWNVIRKREEKDRKHLPNKTQSLSCASRISKNCKIIFGLKKTVREREPS